MDKKSFYLFCLAFLATSFGVATLAPLVPQMAKEFGVMPLEMAHISWYYMLPYGLCALIWAPLSRLIKVKDIFTVTCLGFACAVFLFTISKNAAQAFWAQSMIGIFSSSFMPLSLIVIGKVVPSQQKAKHIGILFGLAYVSSFVGVTLSGFLPWRVVYLVPTVIGLLTAVLASCFLEKFDFRQEEFEISYHKTLKDRKVQFLFVFIFFASFFYHGIQQLLGVYLNKSYVLTQPQLSSLFTVATMCSVIFQFCGGILAKKYKNTFLARTGYFFMGTFAFLLVIINSWQAMYFLMIFWGTGWALNHIGLSSYLTHLPDKVLRDASSMNSSIRFVSGGLGVMAANKMILLGGFQAQFLIVMSAMFLMGTFVNKILID